MAASKCATTAQNKPTSKAYVKVYRAPPTTASVRFFQDGYTDLRGRFDYASLNSKRVTRLAGGVLDAAWCVGPRPEA